MQCTFVQADRKKSIARLSHPYELCKFFFFFYLGERETLPGPGLPALGAALASACSPPLHWGSVELKGAELLALLALKAATVAVGQAFERSKPEWTGRCRASTMLEKEVVGGTRAPG